MKRTLPLGVIALALLLSVSCSLLQSEPAARTYYEGLSLDTPETAVETFVDAFQREDYMTVYLVLSSRAQWQWQQNIQMMRFHPIVAYDDGDELDDIWDDVSVFSDGLLEGEHLDQGWYLFDEIMLAAGEHDAFLIDLRGEATIIENEESETPQGEDAVDVIVEIDGIDDEVIFRMVESPGDRWRVFQVIVEDGDESMAPWAVEE